MGWSGGRAGRGRRREGGGDASQQAGAGARFLGEAGPGPWMQGVGPLCAMPACLQGPAPPGEGSARRVWGAWASQAAQW